MTPYVGPTDHARIVPTGRELAAPQAVRVARRHKSIPAPLVRCPHFSAFERDHRDDVTDDTLAAFGGAE